MTPSYLPKLLAQAQAQGQVDPGWTNLMLQADTRAEAMARDNEGGCCGTRCIRIQPQPITFNIQVQPLTFKWMEFQGNEV